MSLITELSNIIYAGLELLLDNDSIIASTGFENYNLVITRELDIDYFPEINDEMLEADIEKAIEVLKVAPVGNGYCIVVDDGIKATLNRTK